jgi:multidrug resistance efflux pump
VAGISAVVLVGGGGAVAYATSRGTTPTFVTASAGSHSVLQTLQTTGTTEPSKAATVSFTVSGTVSTVPVTMGEKVTAGQVLATLDSTALQLALATAQEQVATANLTLTQAENGQVSTASGASGSAGTLTATGASSASTTKSGTTTTATGANTGDTGTVNTKTGGASSITNSKSSGSSHSGPTADVTAAQTLLVTTVEQIDSLLAKTETDLTLGATACKTQATSPSRVPTPATPTPATPTPATPTPTPRMTPISPARLTTGQSTTQGAALTTTRTGPTASCSQTQLLVLNNESRLLTLEQDLSSQETALDRLINSAAASVGAASTETSATGTASAGNSPATRSSSTSTASASKTPATGAASTGKPSSGTPSTVKTSGSTGSTTTPVSAAQLAADQAALDAANANLVLAQQQLSQATIVSPFAGVVSSVGLTVGQQAAAGSSTEAVDVIDPTGHSVTLSVDVTKIPQVKIGEKATVIPDGSSVPLAANVSYVAAAPTASGSTAYDVQLAFTSNPSTLRDGIQAAVTITTGEAVNALSVPTSAVNHLGSFSYVLVPKGSTTKSQRITVGSVGAIYTQVTSGLTAGQKVVLANPATPIPTSTITGRVARITGGATSSTAGVLGGSTGATTTRPGG